MNRIAVTGRQLMAEIVERLQHAQQHKASSFRGPWWDYDADTRLDGGLAGLRWSRRALEDEGTFKLVAFRRTLQSDAPLRIPPRWHALVQGVRRGQERRLLKPLVRVFFCCCHYAREEFAQAVARGLLPAEGAFYLLGFAEGVMVALERVGEGSSY